MNAQPRTVFFALVISLAALVGCAGNDDERAATTVAPPKADVESRAERIGVVNERLTAPVGPDGVLVASNNATPTGTASPGTMSPERRKVLASLIPSSVADSTASASSSLSPRKPPQPAGPSLDERLLFFPTKYHPSGDWQPVGLKFEEATFASADGTRLHGWYCPSDEPTAVILYCHGNAGNISYDAELFRLLQKRLRATVLGFDYRGYGRSEGRATAAGVTADARAARAWLAKKAGVPETQVVLMGRSLGGAVAVQLTTDVRPRGLILESTFDSLRAMAKFHHPLLSGLVPAGKFDSAAALARYDGPLLQSHGDQDKTIPFTSGESLFAVAQGRKEFFSIPDADHNDPQPAEYYDKLEKFVGELPR